MTARDRLRRHLAIIDGDVEAVTRRHREHIQCGPGCAECCHQTFRVSEIEGALLQQGLARAPRAVQADIVGKARAYRPDAGMPCPVLSEHGHCRLYAHRPRICRKYGIPLWHPDRPHEVRVCRLNFQTVPDLDPGPILQPQAHWARDWLDLRRALGLPSQRDETIAHWLLDPPADG